MRAISNNIPFMKNSKFIPLYETIYDRYKQGSGFLSGDVVKLKSNYKSADSYKDLPEMIKQRLEDIDKSGLNLRIGRLHTHNTSAGSLGINTGMPATHVDLYQEPSPGSFGNLVTIPIGLIEVIDTGVSLPPVSAKNKHANKDYIKPGKWKSNKDEPETKEQNHLGHEQNWVKKGDYKLAEKNVKPSVGGNKYNDEKPSNFKPLKGNKKLTKESVVALEGLYMQMITEDATDDVNSQGYSVTESNKFKVKTECWNEETNSVIPECMYEDGSIKPECWKEAKRAHPVMINGKEVDMGSLEVGGVDSSDYPDFSDAFISAGKFTDGSKMSDDELDSFQNHHSDVAHELAHNSMQGESAPKTNEPVAIKEFQQQKKYMDQEEFLDKYDDAVNALTDAFIENDFLDEDEARLKAIHTIADMKKIEITDLETA